MVTVGLNFTKIIAERAGSSQQNIHIQNTTSILSVKESTIADPKKALLKFEFEFTCTYTPDIGKILLTGELLEIYDKEIATKILTGWGNSRNVAPELMEHILNVILSRANIEALIISREVGLPSPFAMPKATVNIKPKVPEAKTAGEIKPTAKPEVKKDDKKKK